MATLVSPGVEVTVVDESAYGSPGTGTIPLLVVATRDNKTDPTGSEPDGIAKWTKPEYAEQVVRVTSQRELTQYFGNPTFGTNSSGQIIQGSETSEYGLLAAYSYLGQGSTAFIVRADVDLAQLDSTTTEPVADWSTANTYWIDTDASKYGIHEYDSSTGLWNNKIPTVEVITGAEGTPPTATVVTGGYHVVISTTANTIEYYKENGGLWVTAAATTAEHYNTPAAPSNGDVWIKSTQPGNGIDLVIREYTSAWVLLDVQGVGTGAIGGFVPQDGTSVTVLSASTAVEGSILLDSGVADTITLEVVDNAGAPAALGGTTIAQIEEPTATAATGTIWFDDDIDSLDVYVVNAGSYDPVTPTYSTTAPTGPSNGDVWIDTTQAGFGQANERDYPKMYVYSTGLSQWILHSNSDQTTERGGLFADVDDTAGGGSPITGAPDPLVYPDGMLVVNMAQSRNTARVWNGTAWRNGVSNHADGSGRFGRFAQHSFVATAMQEALTGEDLREEQNNFTLLVAPFYPECTDELVTLNSDRGETGFIIVDTPMRLNPTQAINWVQNVNVATENGEDGLVTNNTYSAVYYPSGNSTEPVNGNTVAVPPSHMALYTYAYNDNISYIWFAPAGLTRGVVQNASAVGYLTTENEFKALSLTQGQRDSMYSNKLNPITTFVGQGTSIFGQKTLHQTTSALDRVNVARLVAYLRERFDEIARPFLFEINDDQTRKRVKLVFERFLADILSKRGVFDYVVVCDESNNTPARIDRNELWVDIAIEPAKAAEFIYIPIRIVNTGTL